MTITIPSRRKWSAEQEAIFNEFANGTNNIVIEALAGTGKTTTSNEGFTRAPERKMLYAVFNKKNQREAKEKIKDSRVEALTLHSLGYRSILKSWPNTKPSETIELDRCREILGCDERSEVAILSKITSFCKNLFIDPSHKEICDMILNREFEFSDSEVEMFAGLALEVLKLSKEPNDLGLISFDDMVWLPVALGMVNPKYDLVLVDEAQDQNSLQLEIVIRSSKGRVIVVGDSRQCIYSFRGASHDGIETMKARLNATVLKLTTTYRCPKLIVALAQKYVPDYNAAPSAPAGIQDSICEERVCDMVKVGDAILSRANAPLMPLCLSLLRRNIPARIEGKDIGKQLLATVQKLKAKSVPDFMAKVTSWATRLKARLFKKKNCEARIMTIDDQSETLTAIAEGLKSVAEIENRIRDLFQDSDSSSRPAVVLSTVHKAKGLEWPHVFLLHGTFLKRQNREEENIYYVALTRTMQHLTFIGGEPNQKELNENG